MFEFRIETINKKFEDIKEEVNNGKLLLYAKLEVEDLIIEAKELKTLIKGELANNKLDILINQLKQYLCDIQGLIEQNTNIL